MGSLFIEIGQCGNQIGLQLMDYLEQSSNQHENSYTQRNDHNIYHSIMIDTEPKILRPILENKKKYNYIDSKNIIYCQHGRGNNWALGFMDAKIQQKKKLQKLQERELKFNRFSLKPKSLLDVTYNMNVNTNQYQADSKNNVPTEQLLKENSQVIENCVDIARKEIEKTDYFMGIQMIQSLGGGTGSGLGSRLLEEFRNIFDDVYITNTVIFPSKSGETTLQHYNTILTLAQLQTYSDSVVYFQNDKINNYLSYSKSQNVEKSIDITNINQYIASNLHNLTRLNDLKNYDKFYFQLLMDTTPMPDFKFMEIFTSPFNFDKNTSWEALTDNICSQISSDDSFVNQDYLKENEENQGFQKTNKSQNIKKHTSISVNTVCKSGDCFKTLRDQKSMQKIVNQKLSNALNPVKWNPDCMNYDYIDEKAKSGIDRKYMTTLANRSNISSIVQDITDIAYSKYQANAFLHWYYKYNVERADFEDAFVCMDNIMVNAIIQEAEEKKDQIISNAKQQHNIDKNRIYNQKRELIQKEFQQKLEEENVKIRIQKSKEVSESRLAKMRTRHELVIKLKEEIEHAVKEEFTSKPDKYKKFMKALTIEAMTKLMEKEVSLRCLKKDQQIVQDIKADCEKEFSAIIQKECGVTVNCKININKANPLDEELTAQGGKITGGVILSCFDERIYCANTLNNRIELIFQEYLPAIRQGLFNENK
ncbi:Tubulin/FtsZ, GTPase domain [Pseudocohnilembus persalinus]|uniref:Tubulin delta chain n=1 Tax=Pseudocohnilembus persalinus TaxID=266149 RepID=A0A0V0QWL1_PSEPJ|nr:Tubulin/FtsZ, GTPase domain [Pseudocohnilembus persalinus]|eukprot:KRX06580.1 Tubulin/FtsZ, GTPase domain [Pseudocohnilembus persalinus]